MIDLERLETHLGLAVADELRAPTAAVSPVPSPPAPDPAPAPAAPRRRPSASSPLAPPERVWEELDIEQHGRSVVELVGRGQLAEADLHIAAHADLAHAGTDPAHRDDAMGWSVMRALAAGREDAARAGLDALRDRGDDDPVASERYLVQALWVAVAWGDDRERYDLLDQCRARAWCRDDIAWRGRLCLLLALLGRADEAGREFDAIVASLPLPRGPRASTLDSGGLDLATDLIEAAAVLGDGRRVGLLGQTMGSAPTSMVVVGKAWVCKGSVMRFQALTAAAVGDLGESDRCFQAAAEIHRLLGAELLLARTLDEWGTTIRSHDPQRGGHLLRESADMHRRLGLSRSRSSDVTSLAS